MSATIAVGGWLAVLADAQRGARSRERFETFALAPLLDDVAAAWRARAWVRGAQLRLERPPEGVLLRGDRLGLADACGRLVANAIEHGGDEVLLRARASACSVRVEVLDDGPGLPAPVAELTRCRRGRGLAFAADVAARHGGRLASAPSERGARLVLELPTPREQAG